MSVFDFFDFNWKYLFVQWPRVSKALPENAYQLCSGRLFISVTLISWRGVENKIISEFSSNEDMIQVCWGLHYNCTYVFALLLGKTN